MQTVLIVLFPNAVPCQIMISLGSPKALKSRSPQNLKRFSSVLRLQKERAARSKEKEKEEKEETEQESKCYLSWRCPSPPGPPFADPFFHTLTSVVNTKGGDFYEDNAFTSTPKSFRRASAELGGKVAQIELFCGDENGEISHWSLTECISALKQTQSFPPLSHPVKVENAKRNLRWDSSEQQLKKVKGEEGIASSSDDTAEGATFGAKQQGSSRSRSRSRLAKTSSFSLRKDTRPICSKQPKLKKRWRAHTDAIYSLQLIEDPPTLLTSSFDRLVKVWTLDGTLLGVLRQGEEMSGKRWRFNVDLEAKQKKDRKRASEVIARVNDRSLDSDEEDDPVIDRRPGEGLQSPGSVGAESKVGGSGSLCCAP